MGIYKSSVENLSFPLSTSAGYLSPALVNGIHVSTYYERVVRNVVLEEVCCPG